MEHVQPEQRIANNEATWRMHLVMAHATCIRQKLIIMDHAAVREPQVHTGGVRRRHVVDLEYITRSHKPAWEGWQTEEPTTGLFGRGVNDPGIIKKSYGPGSQSANGHCGYATAASLPSCIADVR
jgi:hypothetical protein